MPGRKGPLGAVRKAAAKEPEWAPPGMVEPATTEMVTPGLLKEFAQGVKEPVSKPPFTTSCGQVGCAVAIAVTGVVEIDTEVTVSVDGRRVGHVVAPDWDFVKVEITVEIGIVGQRFEFDFARVAVTVEVD